MSSVIYFSLNGARIEVPNNLPVETPLSLYLHQYANLRDTKTMCNEGGCGSCIVSVSFKHPVTRKTVHRAVNSCLVSIYSCHGWYITTVSGLGDKKSGYHTLQKTLAEYNGSQCGYCSPGIVMNMHSLMEENENVTMWEVENSFGGNICRCTGYRPILDALKSLASDADWTFVRELEDIEDLDKFKKCPSVGLDCSKLRIGNKFHRFFVETEDATWFKVFLVKDVLDTLRRNKGISFMLVAGNTAKGIYKNKVSPKIYIDINEIYELKSFTADDNIILGANITLTDAMQYLTEVSGLSEFKYVLEIVEHISLIANVPIRNIGTIAGNLSIKHEHPEFSSDLFIILETAGALLKIIDISGIEIHVTPSNYLNLDMRNKIIVSIILPPITGNFTFKTYKIMPRAQNARPYVNAGFYVRFNNKTGNVQKATLVFGGINPTFVHASKTESLLRDVNIFDNSTLRKVLDCLNSELQPDWVLPDACPEYRKNLAICLFYRFVLSMCPEKLISPKNKSGAKLLERGLSSGDQKYRTRKDLWPLQQPIMKLEALYQCAGEAEYIAYIPLKPGELFAAFVLARKPLTTVTNIDAKDALQIEGVIAFYSAKDIPGKNSFTSTKMALVREDEELFCDGLVKYYGQPVGVIVAASQMLAERAAKLVRLDYSSDTKRTPYVDVRDVLAYDNVPSRVKLEESIEATWMGHDISHVFIGSQDLCGQYHYSLETQTAICVPTEDGLDLYPSSHGCDGIQIAVSQVLKIPEHRINVNVRRLGGSFGCKLSRNSQIAAACALAAYHLNTPVRLVMSLEDNMDAIGKRSWCAYDYEVGVSENGKIQYLKSKFYEDLGCSFNEGPLNFAIEAFANCYDKKSFTVDGYAVLTEKPSNTFFRAPGHLEGLAMIENIMEHIAHVTGLDPIDVRKINMTKEDNLVYDNIDDFRKDTEYDKRKLDIMEFNSKSRWRKRGIAIVPMLYAIQYHGKLSAMVCIFHGDGTVAVSHAGVECGQGINTKVAQVCAYTLNIPLDLISIKPTNNMDSPNANFTGASVTSESCCYAAREACKIILERLKPFRGKLGGNPKWPDLIEEAHKAKVDLQAIYSHKPYTEKKSYDVAGMAACEVEVDILTGNVLILRADVREETGESMSPEVDVGQVEGAFVMGLGYWLTEKLVYDKKTCELKTNSTWTYNTPGAKDIPIDFRIEFIRNEKQNEGILRSKATGEPAIVLAFSAVCAIRHALQSARMDANDGKSDEWFTLGAPTTPEDILLHANIDYRQFTV